MESHIAITPEINIQEGYENLIDPKSGGICTFIGTVRDLNNEKEVSNLFFEAYEKMAILKLEELAQEAGSKWPLNKVVLIHAVGMKKITDPVVFVGASSAHRDAAFQASRYLIDRLKEVVPIWKKETYQDHSSWINAHP
ncbi:molybdenum cofactor biosynthesis protein MoaE [Echinicola jeungdonensis]|uniref:Molybdopterin synthase catalytic subunit n=1 Tax=Echinicola jeungdonensis TaxID=709343 RepID=A0ABV5J8R8_9BACT|nr:molybdenum cofactor biosynthesis protein MoaE [Echinicola jeungdonensis]MDN3669653.1 molybdenum cofactor biosynthesis protein MoaE [Echinicola jeungdonensis]